MPRFGMQLGVLDQAAPEDDLTGPKARVLGAGRQAMLEASNRRVLGDSTRLGGHATPGAPFRRRDGRSRVRDLPVDVGGDPPVAAGERLARSGLSKNIKTRRAASVGVKPATSQRVDSNVFLGGGAGPVDVGRGTVGPGASGETIGRTPDRATSSVLGGTKVTPMLLVGALVLLLWMQRG